MQAAFLEAPGRLVVREAPEPEPRPGAVVIRVRAATTCGTDLKAYTRGHPKIPMPTRFGHEYAGEIVAVGPGVAGWAVGDARSEERRVGKGCRWGGGAAEEDR